MNTDQALELLLDGTVDDLDSGDDLEIDEDIDFPLPVDQESDQSEYEGKLFAVSTVPVPGLRKMALAVPEPA